MSDHVIRKIALPSLGPGSPLFMTQHEFTGGSSAKSAYIQAGLHAGEMPGYLVADHLIRILKQLSQESMLLGNITVVPYANPIGASQKVLGDFPGRFYMQTGENFDRYFPSIHEPLQQAVAAQRFRKNDIGAFKEYFQSEMNKIHVSDPAAMTKKILLQEALKHDVVIDLHCALDATLFIVGKADQQSRTMRLAESVSAKAIVLEGRIENAPLDESYARAWAALREVGLVDEDKQGFVAVIELRGRADVNDNLAQQDAMGIIRFLTGEGLIQLSEKLAKVMEQEVLLCPEEGNLLTYCDSTGFIVFSKRPGDMVSKGEKYAEILILDSDQDAERIPVCSEIDGMLLDITNTYVVRAGQRIAWIAGAEPIPSNGKRKFLTV
jgi:uncharacterized protein